jgi:hypothetical protein
MHTRLKGLQSECDLLSAEIELCRSGGRREYDYAPNGSRVDITDLWIAHLQAVLAVKRSLRAKLKERYGIADQPDIRAAGDPKSALPQPGKSTK